MKKTYKFALLAFVLLTNFVSFAQPSSDDDTGNGNLDGDDLPINSKLIFLAVAGVLFGIYSLKKFRKVA